MQLEIWSLTFPDNDPGSHRPPAQLGRHYSIPIGLCQPMPAEELEEQDVLHPYARYPIGLTRGVCDQTSWWYRIASCQSLHWWRIWESLETEQALCGKFQCELSVAHLRVSNLQRRACCVVSIMLSTIPSGIRRQPSSRTYADLLPISLVGSAITSQIQ